MRYITSFISNLSKGIALGTGAAFLALGVASPVGAIIINWKFGLVGVVFDANQVVQVNVANYGNPEDAPAPCAARVQFFEGITGALLKDVRLTVQSGRTQTADLGVTELILQRGKVPIYARVAIGDPNTRPACGSPSLEVFDKVSGRTTVAVGNPEEYGDPNQHLPTLTLAPGQAMRLNVVNFGPPIVLPPTRDPGPCTVQLAIFAADGSQVGQAQEILASGVGTFLDVGWGNPDDFPQPFRGVGGVASSAGAPGTPGSARASPSVPLCRNLVFSVEVYDAATGIDTVLQSAQ